jgi:2',3'-cyclic-nucleotide 2'-phosphodiesterase (5'-nucleotidase family)
VQQEKKILLLDAGDLFFKKFASPHPKDELNGLTEKAHLIVESLNLMGYDAIGIGDDDLSLGKEFLLELSGKAKFPFLSSNLLDEKSGKLLFQSYLVKEMKGLKIGIFSLLSPETFLTSSDPRKKGIIVRDPIETAQEMIRELGPKTDILILLSHQGYSKDTELAQRVDGIQIIAGAHTGTSLNNPPVFKDTVILQNYPKGMYATRLDLTFHNTTKAFYNIRTKQALESNLSKLELQLASPRTPEAEKAQWQKAKENTTKALQQFEGKNQFAYSVFSLSDAVGDDPEIKKMVDEYKSKFPEKSEAPVHDSRGSYTPKPVEPK